VERGTQGVRLIKDKFDIGVRILYNIITPNDGIKDRRQVMPNWKGQLSFNRGASLMMMPGAWRAASSGTMPT
jgi:hypothetical protein